MDTVKKHGTALVGSAREFDFDTALHAVYRSGNLGIFAVAAWHAIQMG